MEILYCLLAINWAEYFKPSIDLLIAIIGASVLIWKYLKQKEKESADRIIETKQKAYLQFFHFITDVELNYYPDEERTKKDEERVKAYTQLLLFANDKVISAFRNWMNEIKDDEKKIYNENSKVLLGKLLIEIRRDIHGMSKLTDKDIIYLNPLSWC